MNKADSKTFADIFDKRKEAAVSSILLLFDERNSEQYFASNYHWKRPVNRKVYAKHALAVIDLSKSQEKFV
jgi:hypothetical protein